MEVHIRKLDTDEKLHWRLLSSVPVHASADAIWKVLTNYEKLDEVVPLLLVSEEKKGVRSNENRPANLKRIRQVAAKKLPYVQLHSEVVLDVLEKPGVDDSDTWELQFRHHKSSFKMLQVCVPRGAAVMLVCCLVYYGAKPVLSMFTHISIPGTASGEMGY